MKSMPNAFDFRFEKVLSYKNEIEEKAKMDLSDAVERLEHERHQLRIMENQYHEAVEQWNCSIGKQLRVSEMQLKSNQIQWIADLITLQHEALRKAEEKMEVCRKILIEAKKDTRKFEKIREKDLNLFQEAEQKMERASIDQFVSHRNAVKY
jgi:flagellar protein FliJ